MATLLSQVVMRPHAKPENQCNLAFPSHGRLPKSCVMGAHWPAVTSPRRQDFRPWGGGGGGGDAGHPVTAMKLPRKRPQWSSIKIGVSVNWIMKVKGMLIGVDHKLHLAMDG